MINIRALTPSERTKLIKLQESDCCDHSYTLPQGFPSLQGKAAYWDRKEQEERTGGVNDFIEEEQQYLNYEGHEL